MIPLPPRQLVITNGTRQRLKSVPQWGIPIDTDMVMTGKRLLLCVDKDGAPLPITPNPRWMPINTMENKS